MKKAKHEFKFITATDEAAQLAQAEQASQQSSVEGETQGDIMVTGDTVGAGRSSAHKVNTLTKNPNEPGKLA